ncbi:hypothetical protein FOZ62_023933 [Perkinsus olseni]|uniref:Uncharacterized protein n=2 Tax=Perkinsus olseni TaxID=32597 RepID=A0A7J6ND63_PEROL|nr:hypothetical protein FOZ62_023933 [Perkinsus olseni]
MSLKVNSCAAVLDYCMPGGACSSFLSLLMFNRASLVFLGIPSVLAWGPDGHAIIADTASKYFNTNAEKAVSEIMGEGTRLADCSTWADTVLHGPERDEWKWSSGLHFADVNNCKFVYSEDCKDDYCVAGGIKNYTRQVVDTSLPFEQRQVALKFLTHFMGDIHQPLHVGRYADYGGNTIHVDYKFADQKTSALHKVWDEKLIDEFEGEGYGGEYIYQDVNYGTPVGERDIFWGIAAADLEKDLAEGGAFHEKIPQWLEDCEANGLDECVNTMVSETAAAACSFAYEHVGGTAVLDKDVLPMEYYNERIEVVKEQLAKAIVRFAWVMNNAFPEDTPTTTTSAPTDCSEADKKCELSYPGSYCKYWQTVPVCFGSDVPCSC